MIYHQHVHFILLSFIFLVCVCVCVRALPSMTTVGYWVLYTKKFMDIYILIYRLSADQMGGTTSTVKVSEKSSTPDTTT